MTGDRPIPAYLAALRAQLPGGRRGRERVAREVEDHLETAASVLERSGYTRLEAERQAVARFGGPADLARALHQSDADRAAGPFGPGGRLLLALVINALALVIVVRSLPDESIWTVVLKFGLLAALFVYSAIVLARPLSPVSSTGGAALAAVGVVLVGAYVYSEASWPGFGACFTTIGGLLIVQGSVGVLGRPPQPLTT